MTKYVELGGLTDYNTTHTPMEEGLKLSHDSTVEEVDAAQYWHIVSNLRYLVHTRPYLAFTVGYICRFINKPSRGSYAALRVPPTTAFNTRGAWHGALHLVQQRAHRRHRHKKEHQRDAVLPQQASEQQAVGQAAGGSSVQCRDAEAMEQRVDSKSPLALAKIPIFHKRIKHIRVKYHFIRSCLDEGSVRANYINPQDQFTDFLTKSLGRVKFQKLHARIGMTHSPEGAT